MINFPSWSDFGTHEESLFPELWQGCVGAWAPCLGPTGARLHDLSRYHNWGTLTNMDVQTDWDVSGGQYALDCDGTNDYIDCGNSAAYSGLSAISVSAWVKIDTLPPASSGSRMWIVTKGNTSNFEFELSINSFNNLAIPYGRYVFTSYSLSGAQSVGRGSAIAATTGTWINIVATQSSKTATPDIYLGGVLSNGPTEPNGTPTVGSGTAPIQIGRRANASDRVIDGQVDDIRIYNRALSETEIRLLATRRGIAFERRKRRSAFFDAAFFNPAWARNSNVIISPVGAA